MSEMIERVKLAITNVFAPAVNMNAPYAKVMLDMAAKAAIEAMQVPTDEMIDAADNVRHFTFSNENSFATYQAMIDEALK